MNTILAIKIVIIVTSEFEAQKGRDLTNRLLIIEGSLLELVQRTHLCSILLVLLIFKRPVFRVSK